MLLIEFGFVWPSSFRGEVNIVVIYMYVAPGLGQMSPWGSFFLSLILGHTTHFLQVFFPLIDILRAFPIQMHRQKRIFVVNDVQKRLLSHCFAANLRF